MITLLADNRILANDAKYSYLNDNYTSGVSTIQIANTSGFAASSFIVMGEFGDENTEIFRIGTVNSSTGEITLKDADGNATTTKFAHPESTKVLVTQFDQIRFYWTAALGTIADETPTFDTVTPLTSWAQITPAEWYTTYDDSAHSTGFGWFVLRNSVTLVSGQTSNPIPYAGFAQETVANLFATFDSMINVNELKLVSLQDKFNWLSEGLALLKNKLNLTNSDFLVSSRQSIAIVADTSEYSLPSDFSDLIEITDNINSSTSVGYPIPFIPISQVLSYTGDVTKYSLRERYIVFTPTPDATATYYYRYKKKSTRVTSLSDYIILPDNADFSLVDWMLFRCMSKFKDPSAASHYQSFVNAVNLYIQSSVKRSANLDSWDISASANV